HSINALMAPEGLVDRPLGPADAAVTVIEYASPTCPHCATFHVDTYPALKEQYVDTGKIQFILRPFIRNVPDAAVFMLAECSDESYHDLIAAYFERQDEWASSNAMRDAIYAIAQDFGFTEETFAACLDDQDLYATIEAERTQAIEQFDLEATPTFYINGKQVSGALPIDAMAAEIDPLL
ncbi:MAG TPA: DsbA family protein, partial [Devosiaceae bacterium]|nr:DsbA family protein [Devosiaceae bacterium]